MGCCPQITSKDRFIFFTLGSVIFTNSFFSALQGPFYTLEAQKKGATATETGLVFGVYSLVSFISCPIFGKYVGHIGAKFLYNVGILTMGTCAVLLGLLSEVNSPGEFVILSFIIRIVEALGASANMTAGFCIAATAFPDSVNIMLGNLDVFYSMGLIFGPSIGGLLYEVGGFMLPFTTVGVLLLFEGLFVLIALPNFQDTSYLSRPPANVFSVLKVPSVVFAFYSLTAATISSSYYDATLEPHLEQFELSPLRIGGIFVIIGITYTLAAPLVGRLCVTQAETKQVTFLGSFLIILSFLLVGPAPFMFFNTTLWVICLGLVFQGLGYACLLAASFIYAHQSSIAAGFPDDVTTYSVVSGLMASAFFLGGAIGPSVAGYLYNTVGFQNGVLFVVVIHVTLILGIPCLQNRGQGPRYALAPNPTESRDISKPLFAAENRHRDNVESNFVMVRKTTYGSVFMDKNNGRIRWQRDP